MPEDHLNTEITFNTSSPIKHLSIDAFRQIFELRCNDDPLTLSLDHRGWKPTSLITLSHVCAEWRAIMLDTPTFWNNIKILHGNHDTPHDLDSIVKKADKLLSRAKGLPCSVEVGLKEGHSKFGGGRPGNWHNNIVRDLMLLHKVNQLCIIFTYQQLRDLLELPDDRLSSIEDLCIEYLDPEWRRDTSPLGLHRFSGLRSFSISSIPISSYYRFNDIPWHNLRHIEFSVMTRPYFCLDILGRSAAVLETCTLLLTGVNDFEALQVPIHLPQLRELGVFTDAGSETLEVVVLRQFLLLLRLPNLKSLKLGSLNTFSRTGITLDIEMLLQVQHASEMHLEELFFTESTLGVDFRTLLLAFPSLRRLQLPREATYTSDAIAEIGAGSIGTCLQHLTMGASDYHELGNLLQMIKARSCVGNKENKRAVGFKSALLYCEADATKEMLDMIEQINLLGVDLKVDF